MTSPDGEIRTFLQTLVLGAPVFDRVPEGQAWPYIHIQDISNSDMFTSDRTIWEVELLLDIVTGYNTIAGGRKDADTIGNAVLTELCDTPYRDLGNYAIVKTTLLNSTYIDEDTDSGYIVRKLMRFALILSGGATTEHDNPEIVSATVTYGSAIVVIFSKEMITDTITSNFSAWQNGIYIESNLVEYIDEYTLLYNVLPPYFQHGDIITMAITPGLLAADDTVFQGAAFNVTNLI